MNSLPAALKILLIYLVCIPLALLLGYQLSNPFSYDALVTVGIVLLVLVIPLMLKWHRELLYFSLGSIAVVFFLPGRPKLALVMVGVSLMISVLQRMLQHRSRFIRAPELTWPVLAVMMVVVGTMFLRGGLGFNFMGSRMVGGGRYVMLLLGVMCYFAMTAQPIPRDRINSCVALFFLGGVTAVVGDLFTFAPTALHPIFLIFPPSMDMRSGEVTFGVTRLFGVALMAAAIYRYMLARYGLRGIFYAPTRARLFFFLLVTGVATLGGFRSIIIGLMLLFAMMFYLEGLHRTRLVIPVVIFGALAVVLAVALLPKMPITVQRALAFLPLEVDPAARLSAENSSEWRLAMWKAVWPEVPNYLLLGKGLGFSEADYQAITNIELSARSPDHWMWAVITGDFHNGPLSVVLTFGIWGLIAYVWLHLAGLRALYLNYRHGDPALRTINTFVLTLFSVQMVMFWFVFGSMYSETIIFVSLLGFSVALNGGVVRRKAEIPFAVPAGSPKDRPARIQPGMRPADAVREVRERAV